MGYALKYAPHLGYKPPEVLLFQAMAGDRRADHVRFAARHGFAGFAYHWVTASPVSERDDVAAAAAETGLPCSSIVALPREHLRRPLFVSGAPEERSVLLDDVHQSIVAAKVLNCRTLVVLIAGDPDCALAVQWRAAVDAVRAVADLAADHGMIIAIEPMISIPGMLLRSFAEGVELVRQVKHPAVKLLYDTGHLYDMGDPLLETFLDAYDDICALQIADMPARVEPGVGVLDIRGLLSAAIARGFSGFVELEFNWAEPGARAEQDFLETLVQLDRTAAESAASR